MGLALLVNIVAIADLATPVPFRVFTEGPPNLLPGTFPYVWLPTVLVQLALVGHLLLFRRLRGVGGNRHPVAPDGGLPKAGRIPTGTDPSNRPTGA